MALPGKRNFVVIQRGATKEGGELWFPERLTEEFLESQKERLGPYLYSVLYQNEPVAPEDIRFLPSWIIYEPFKYYWDGYTRVLRPTKGLEVPVYVTTTVDPAFTDQKYSDYTGIITVGCSPDNDWFILSARRVRGGVDKVSAECIREVREYRPYKLAIEKLAIQYAFKDILIQRFREDGLVTSITELPSHSRAGKHIRIENLVPRFADGKVFFQKGLGPELEHELRQWSPRGKQDHDDLIDALSHQLTVSRPAPVSGMETPAIDILDLPPDKRNAFRKMKQEGVGNRDSMTGY